MRYLLMMIRKICIGGVYSENKRKYWDEDEQDNEKLVNIRWKSCDSKDRLRLKMKCEVKVLWWASVALLCVSQCFGDSDDAANIAVTKSPQSAENKELRDRWNRTEGDSTSWCPSCAVSSLVEEMRRDCGERPGGGQAPPPDVVACAEAVLGRLLQRAEQRDLLPLAPGLALRRTGGGGSGGGGRSGEPLATRVARFLRTHALTVSLRDAWAALTVSRASTAARSFFGLFPPGAEAAGKSSFLAGFGLGFLAFALKKLLLPVLIGAQIAKSILIAMFLPSLLGGLGKVLNRGVSTFASASSASGSNGGGGGGTANLEDFEFKDNLDAAESSYPSGTFAYPETPGVLPASAIYKDQPAVTSFKPTAAPKLGMGLGNYYASRPAVLGPGVKAPRPHDFKVFHQIPKSSLLLSHYDPFYSPLLSRLDSVFKQLGSESEPCREQLVCEMYSSPARFAPYSNLVSAQLSRELNELRKPSTDNPEILRFFRYMKAAKDGQDGLPCAQLHPGCSASASRPPLLQTFHDINKLVHARRLGRLLPAPPRADSHTESQLSETGDDVIAYATVPSPTVTENNANSTAETEQATAETEQDS